MSSFDMKIVIEDFNTQIGIEDIYTDEVVRHSIDGSNNDNGLRLITMTI